MGHYSYLVVGDSQFLYTRSHYNEELAALFNETDRKPTASHGNDVTPGDEGETPDELGYYTTARALRQRLTVQGFTSHRALADLANGVGDWRKRYDSQTELRDREARGETLVETLVRPPRDPDELLAAIGEAIRPHQPEESFATFQEYWQYENRLTEVVADVEELRWFVEERSLTRLIIDQASDDTRVGLDLSGLTGCCVNLDTTQLVAGPTRERQLAALPDNAPLIVLVEGSTDSRSLTNALHVTHPHLVGFVRFIDYAGAKAQGSAGTVANMVKAFIAAGVANRFVAVADNDVGGHEAFAQLKKQKLPEGCRVMHYPDLPLLTSYPTIDPASGTVSFKDVNGSAGSLEMYLGEDVLTIEGALAPVREEGFSRSVQRHQGKLSPRHKRRVQKAFNKKVKAARRDPRSGSTGDWSGVHAIIESIVNAFD